jgi:hypothetical protein
MARYGAALAMIVALLPAAGCATYGQRVPTNVEAVTTHEFNPTDLQIICNQAVAKLLAKNILPPDTKPAVIVTKVDNNTDEHVNTPIIRQYITSELSDSNKVRLVSAAATGEPGSATMKQLEFQQSAFVDPTTAKKIGKMVGADYIVQGELSNITSEAGSRKGQYFLFTLTLVSIETGEFWTSKVDIQKESKSGWFGW